MDFLQEKKNTKGQTEEQLSKKKNLVSQIFGDSPKTDEFYGDCFVQRVAEDPDLGKMKDSNDIPFLATFPLLFQSAFLFGFFRIIQSKKLIEIHVQLEGKTNTTKLNTNYQKTREELSNRNEINNCAHRFFFQICPHMWSGKNSKDVSFTFSLTFPSLKNKKRIWICQDI